MERLPFTTGGRRHGDAAISDVANVQNEVATLFNRFRLDLEYLFGRSPQKGRLGHEVTHPLTASERGDT